MRCATRKSYAGLMQARTSRNNVSRNNAALTKETKGLWRGDILA